MAKDIWLQPRVETDEMPKTLRQRKLPLKAVMVDWVDCTGFRGWNHKDSWTDRMTNHCRSLGYLVSEDSEAIHLAGDIDNVGNLNNRQAIPRGCIKAIRTLEMKDGKSKSKS